MNESILLKLEKLCMRFEEISVMLNDTEIIANIDKFTQLSKEYSKLSPVQEKYQQYLSIEKNIVESEKMLNEQDAEIQQMAKEDIFNNKNKIKQLTLDLQKLLLPKDPNDSSNIIIEIRAGTGGNEASLFSGDLYKMYASYVEKNKWQIEIISSSMGEQGGFKEIIAKISGKNVYSKLKFESGAHRVQRIPETESQGRVHTSACTVAVMPEITTIEEIDIDLNDIRIDTFKSSGAGGQHVNKTDSAVRVTHIPTGTVVECQEGRSQHKNKAQALSVLASRILDAKKQEQTSKQASQRKELVGSGDRSERIRTYNYPQGRVTDHRINLTLYKLNEIMDGYIDLIIEQLIIEQEAKQLINL